MSKKNKPLDLSILDNFLAKDSFLPKEENDIWMKFAWPYFFKPQSYYYKQRNHNQAIIQSRGQTYYYLVCQDKALGTLYKKIPNDVEPNSVWNNPNNVWNYDLLWEEKTKSWIDVTKLPPLPVYTPEEDAISIIENVILSRVKEYNKTIDFDSKKFNMFLEKSDFCYTYVADDRQWHMFYPSLEKLQSYAVKFNRQMFLDFLNSEECFYHREMFGNLP